MSAGDDERAGPGDDREARRALADVVGFTDERLTDRLLGAGIGAESFAALRFLPLVMVAWADGVVRETERRAVLDATREVTGIGWGTPAYAQLERWLDFPPREDAVALWGEYVRSLKGHLDAAKREVLRTRTLSDARAIAKASGGVLKLGSISAAEAAVLERLSEILA